MQTCGVFYFGNLKGFAPALYFPHELAGFGRSTLELHGLSAREHSLRANACALCCTCLRDH